MTMKDADVKLLLALMANCRRSDRDLAKASGVSQPTVTRKRTLLQHAGIIQRYMAVPDLAKIGFRIIAVSFGKLESDRKSSEDVIAKTISTQKNILFLAKGQGCNAILLCISAHRDYSDFVSFHRGLSFAGIDSQSFLIDTASDITKPFIMDLNANDIEIQK